MSSIILNIAIVSAILIPMGYLMFGNDSSKKGVKSFKEKLKEMGFVPNKIGSWQSGYIGIDQAQNKLVYISQYQNNELKVIELKDITNCEVKKAYHTEQAHQVDISMLKDVTLSLKTVQKSEILIPFYKSSVHSQPGNDLLEAIDWAKLINKNLK